MATDNSQSEPLSLDDTPYASSCSRPLSGVASESSPLLAQPPLPPPRGWRVWRRSSPQFRWMVLLLAMIIPFGPHVVKSSLSSLAPLFLSDPEFHLTHAQFGSFQSALSLPNLFVPFLGGLLLDIRGSRTGTLIFLALALIGHGGFALACSHRSYFWAVVTRAIFGLGQGSTVVSQGRIAASFFGGREVVFAIALCESFHNVSALIARVFVVPLAKRTGEYTDALWIGSALCAVSFIAGIAFYVLNPHAHPKWKDEHRQQQRAALNAHLLAEHDRATGGPHHAVSMDVRSVSESSESTRASLSGLVFSSGLPISFILLCFLHLVHSNAVHLFDYVSADFIQSKYGTSIEKGAALSALSSACAIVLCPIVGYALDKIGYKMMAVFVCSVLTCTAYLTLALTWINPAIPLALMSVSIATVPTILRAAVPDCVNPAWLGLAYGAYEVMESVGSVIGHVSVGLIVDWTQSYQMDILAFAAMAATAAALACVLSVTDSLQGGKLNAPSRRDGDGDEHEQEETEAIETL